jgi:methylene-tetrahydromethanopterin dehydrogenase
MSDARILHFLTPLKHPSPFDVNVAIDAGFVVAGYTMVGFDEITALTQDAMFSRVPQDAAKTCLFIGGRDALLALDMAAAAKAAMFPPFVVSVFADPAGAFTTAAAMVAYVEHHLRRQGGTLAGAKVAVFGAKGVVGGIAGVLAAAAGADVTLVAHDHSGTVPAKAAAFEARFTLRLRVAEGMTDAQKRMVLSDCDVVLAAGPVGVCILSRADLEHAERLKIAADLNAVPPFGIEGVDAKADGAPLGFAPGIGVGALAIGKVKFELQHALLRRIRSAEKAAFISSSCGGRRSSPYPRHRRSCMPRKTSAPAGSV